MRVYWEATRFDTQDDENIDLFKQGVAPESFSGVLGKPGTLRNNVPKAIIPSDNLFSPKIRLKHFPMRTEVTDFPKPVAALFQN